MPSDDDKKEDVLVGMDLASGPSKSFEITGKIEDGKLEVLSVKEIDPPPPTEVWHVYKIPLPEGMSEEEAAAGLKRARAIEVGTGGAVPMESWIEDDKARAAA